ncbi:Ger(x)C family spore germination protein [Paenibacillus larvae]|uniref:Ger(x)C family spore germination protein n=2 Tax=Paenibacillus larvae TaxID=1464 RepID=UPI002892622B|nr:Ger(x)C family spore germination protein [Paenibacillus larvae]MDT2311645.1 Ger(x)C family spore germination protein [Paenibacillus larvae]
MRRKIQLALLSLSILALAGCGDRIDVEDATLALLYGMELEDDHLNIYEMNPVFNKNAEKKYEMYKVSTDTTRHARPIFNSKMNGQLVTGKVQVLMFSNDMLEKEGIMPYLDSLYRDAKNAANMRLITVKGSVSSILNSEFKDKPILPTYLTNLIDVGKRTNQAAFVTNQEFHTQAFEKGITPAITEIQKKEENIQISGSSLLDNRGKYRASLSRRESAFMVMLQRKANMPLSITLTMPTEFKRPSLLKNISGKDFITMTVFNTKRKVKTRFSQGQFAFDVHLKMEVAIEERTFEANIDNELRNFTRVLNEQIKKELDTLLEKIRQNKLDPIGFGIYARAFCYPEWKKVKDNWPETFAEAKVNIYPDITIRDHGVTE